MYFLFCHRELIEGFKGKSKRAIGFEERVERGQQMTTAALDDQTMTVAGRRSFCSVQGMKKLSFLTGEIVTSSR
jgi:hypothetical protein